MASLSYCEFFGWVVVDKTVEVIVCSIPDANNIIHVSSPEFDGRRSGECSRMWFSRYDMNTRQRERAVELP